METATAFHGGRSFESVLPRTQGKGLVEGLLLKAVEGE
jgi:hypothetical protein